MKTINQIFYIASYGPTYMRIQHALNNLPVLFTTQNIFSGFHGIEFIVEVPRGRGCRAKIKKIHEILEK